MKFSVKLIAAALCAAMLCVPALAAASATGSYRSYKTFKPVDLK